MNKIVFSFVNPLFKSAVGRIEPLPSERVIYGIKDDIYHLLIRNLIPNSCGLKQVEMRVWDSNKEGFVEVDFLKESHEIPYTYILEITSKDKKSLSSLIGTLVDHVFNPGLIPEMWVRDGFSIREGIRKGLLSDGIPLYEEDPLLVDGLERLGFAHTLQILRFFIKYNKTKTKEVCIYPFGKSLYTFSEGDVPSDEAMVNEFLRNDFLEAGNIKALTELLFQLYKRKTKLVNSINFIGNKLHNINDANRCMGWRVFKVKDKRVFAGGTIFQKAFCLRVNSSLITTLSNKIKNKGSCMCAGRNTEIEFASEEKLETGELYLAYTPHIKAKGTEAQEKRKRYLAGGIELA